MSKAGIGTILTGAFALLSLFGIKFPEGTEAGFVDAVWVIVGVAMLVWGQLDRPDLKWGLFRK